MVLTWICDHLVSGVSLNNSHFQNVTLVIIRDVATVICLSSVVSPVPPSVVLTVFLPNSTNYFNTLYSYILNWQHDLFAERSWSILTSFGKVQGTFLTAKCIAFRGAQSCQNCDTWQLNDLKNKLDWVAFERFEMTNNLSMGLLNVSTQ